MLPIWPPGLGFAVVTLGPGSDLGLDPGPEIWGLKPGRVYDFLSGGVEDGAPEFAALPRRYASRTRLMLRGTLSANWAAGG